jgi:uncharacterized protein (DUF885 family)
VKRRLALTLSLVLLAVACRKQEEPPPPEPASAYAFRAFVDDHFRLFFEMYPSYATAAGLHEYDHHMEDFSADRFKRRQEQVKSLLSRIDGLRASKLNPEETIDAALLEAQLQSELQDLSVLVSWRRNPMLYVGTPGSAIDGLMKRDFAPAAERLQAITSRLRGVEPLLRNMQLNMEIPPKEFTDLAIRMAKGSVGFFKETLPGWAKSIEGADAELVKNFETANQEAAEAMGKAAQWLERDLKPRSKGIYAIGSKNLLDKLRYDEMVKLPLWRLSEVGEANLEKDYRAFVETARRIDPNKTPAEVMAMLSGDHPSEDQLLDFTRQTLEGARKFLADKRIIDLPSEVRPAVVETPPYARSGSFASMDTPGAFERKAKEAFYYVTPPEKEWTRKHKEEHLRLYNRPVLEVITVHEVFPGHYTQFLYAPQFPTKTRKLIAVGSNSEGWAHYAEQMMIEEGFGNGNPKIRLAQLSEALLRDCRYVAAIKLHTQNWTVEQAAKLFVQKGFQEPANAYEEARRGAWNPTYLYYTLGKLQIYKLREDYRKEKGKNFSLHTFHQEFIKQGSIPIELVRRILLPNSKEPSL